MRRKGCRLDAVCSINLSFEFSLLDSVFLYLNLYLTLYLDLENVSQIEIHFTDFAILRPSFLSTTDLDAIDSMIFRPRDLDFWISRSILPTDTYF